MSKLNLTDTFAIARHETATTFRGRKGVLLGATLFLLAAVPAVLRLIAQHSPGALELQRAHTAAILKLYDRDIARYLLDCPPSLVVAAIATFFFQPLFVLLAGSDRLAGAIEGGGVRYWTVRAPRAGIVVGKALGLWAVVSILTVAVQAAVAIISVIDDPRHWLSTLGWAAQIMLSSCATALLYAALCTLVGAVLPRPRFVPVLGLGVVTLLRIARVQLEQHGAPSLARYFPGALDGLFLSPGAVAKLLAVAVVAGWTAALLWGATRVFDRRAV